MRAFENKVKLSGTRAYNGRFLDSNVVDSYSTALQRKFCYIFLSLYERVIVVQLACSRGWFWSGFRNGMWWVQKRFFFLFYKEFVNIMFILDSYLREAYCLAKKRPGFIESIHYSLSKVLLEKKYSCYRYWQVLVYASHTLTRRSPKTTSFDTRRTAKKYSRIFLFCYWIGWYKKLHISVCPFTSNNKGIVALIDVRPTDGICDTTCLLCNRYNVSNIYRKQYLHCFLTFWLLNRSLF